MKRREFLKLSVGATFTSALPIDPASAQPAASSLDKIKHIVVLMLENRSFDNMLGRLYEKSETFDGLNGREANPDLDGNPVLVNNRPGSSLAVMTTPNPNPGELWSDMNEQLFGAPDTPSSGAVPTMDGFVRNYMKQRVKLGAPKPEAEHIMHYFAPEQVPVLTGLARQFAVSDRWFASAPTQTWPNRFFTHCATANGYENNTPFHFPYRMPTIFERLQVMNPVNGWQVVFRDAPLTLSLANLWKHRDKFRRFPRFLEQAAAGTLPAYTFIEPDYLSFLGSQSDAHPPSTVAAAEVLLADVYNALRASPAWTSTLLVITYDEHGGCYDHVPPPAAVPPSNNPSGPFNFDRFGVRVPAVLVSPHISQGRIVRPSGATPFDHTSIIATLRKRFPLGEPLSQRDAAAPTLEVALDLPAPTNLGPERIEAPEALRSIARAAAPGAGGATQELSELQESLEALAEILPNPGEEAAQIARLEAVPSPSAARAPGAARSVARSPDTVGAAIDQNVRRFLGES